jgi:hypothetical protein
MRDARGRYAELEQAVMRAEAMIEHDYVVAGFHDVSRTHALQRRRRRAGSQ